MSGPEALVEEELRSLDEALEAGALTATEAGRREFQELALALAAQAPRPEPSFAEELGERARQGFPRRRPRLAVPSLRGLSRPRLSRSWPRRLPRPSPPVLGGVAAALAALVVAVALIGGEDRGERSAGPPGEAREGAGAAPAGGAAADAPAAGPQGLALPPPAAPPAGGGFAPGEPRRRIERSAALTLAAPPQEAGTVAERIVAVTDRLGGFVLGSSVSSGDEGGGGRFDLRIPAARLQAALRDLSALADVRSRSQEGRDVTRDAVSAEDRLEAARAERRSLLRRLERAGSDARAEAIRRRLDLNAGEIRGLRARVRDLRQRTGYAAVSVTLEERDADGGSSGGGGLGGALDDALRSIEVSAGIAVRVLGVALPLALLGALGWGASRLVARRRREAALS